MQGSTQQALISISQPLKLHEPSHHTAADDIVDWLIIPIKHWECAPLFLRHRHHQTITTVLKTLPIRNLSFLQDNTLMVPSVDPLVCNFHSFLYTFLLLLLLCHHCMSLLHLPILTFWPQSPSSHSPTFLLLCKWLHWICNLHIKLTSYLVASSSFV